MIFTYEAGKTVDKLIQLFDHCPWGAHSGTRAVHGRKRRSQKRAPLYTEEQRRRRDSSHWTLVQGVLAPIQFVVFLISLYFVLRFMATGEGYAIATASIVVKTLILYTIMVTGSLWEREVFGRYLFARPFFWEDVVSMLVLALHTAYLAVLFTASVGPQDQMVIALAAYATYVVNMAQFVLKLRMARQDGRRDSFCPPDGTSLAK